MHRINGLAELQQGSSVWPQNSRLGLLSLGIGLDRIYKLRQFLVSRKINGLSELYRALWVRIRPARRLLIVYLSETPQWSH